MVVPRKLASFFKNYMSRVQPFIMNPMMYHPRGLIGLNFAGAVNSARNITTTPVLNQPPSLVKMRRLQTEFQCDDGKPVWLKGGMKDRVLSTLTFILCAIGLLDILLVLYQNAKPTSWKQADKC